MTLHPNLSLPEGIKLAVISIFFEEVAISDRTDRILREAWSDLQTKGHFVFKE